MGKSRAPEIDEEGLARHLSDNTDLTALRNRFLQYEVQRQANELATPYIAFEALVGLLGARLNGHSDEQVRACWPDDWGTSAVSLPASVLMALAHGWIEYKQSENGQTLGEVFRIEGKGQGKPKAIARQRAVDRNRKYAIRVLLYYTQQRGTSLEAAIARAAEDFSVSEETVQLAYKKYGKLLTAKAQTAGVLKGGVTS
jgi:hypothetical protein